LADGRNVLEELSGAVAEQAGKTVSGISVALPSRRPVLLNDENSCVTFQNVRGDSSADLDEFVVCYNPANRHDRTGTWSEASPEGRWRSYPYEVLTQRDKCSLDIFWLRDESLEDSENLPPPDVIAAEIVEDLRAALEQFAEIQADLTRQS
jgi:hypothetical protein